MSDRTVNPLADPEVVAAEHGHWAAGGFPDSLDEAGEHIVCECGMPWTPGEGCLFVQGIRAQRLAVGKVQVRHQFAVRDDVFDEITDERWVGGTGGYTPWTREAALRGQGHIKNWTAVERTVTTVTTAWAPIAKEES